MTGKPEMPQGDPAEQAIYWLTWLTSGEAGEEQHRAFDHWLNEKPAHRQAWNHARALWQDVSRLTIDEFDDPVVSKKPVTAIRKPYRPTPITAFGAILVCAFIASLILVLQELPFYLADYRTDTGQREAITLADGSKILLNTHSAVSVDYSDSARRLTLHGGEAWFQVAADPTRPFEVSTDYGTVRALGTAFDIQQNDRKVTVTVYEHAVEVRSNAGEKSVQVGEGSEYTFNESVGGSPTQADLAKSSAWHQGKMVFKGRRLEQVIEELNRYREGEILIAAQSLDDLPLTGVFDTANPEEALGMIRQSLKLSEFRIGDRFVFLYRE